MNKLFYNILLYLTYVGFNLENIFNIGKDPLLFKRVYLLGIPVRDITLIIMLEFFVFNIKSIFRVVKPSQIFLFFFVICFFTFQGLIINGLSAIPDRKSTRLNSSHTDISRMPSSAWKKKKKKVIHLIQLQHNYT